jgi:hypothetical protein
MPRREDLVHMVAVTNGVGVAVVTVAWNGQVLVDGAPLKSARREDRRRWALEQAVKLAHANPGLDVTTTADQILAWLGQQSSPIFV